MLKAILLIIPLGLDTFAVAAALGIAGLPSSRRLGISVLFALFEAAMPLAGLGLGAAAGSALGRVGDFVGAGVLAAVGLYTLLAGRGDDERRAGLLGRTRGLALVGLALSISLDEVAIGFTIGLLSVPVGVFVAVVGAQAFVFCQLGLRMGARLGERVAERAEQLAGVALLALAGLLVVSRL